MGEYYNWVNVDRKEYICPSDFDYGNKRYESCGRTCNVLRALRDLLANEWKGCRVFWIGDEIGLPDITEIELFAVIKSHCDELGYGNDMFDTVCESYKNMSGLFKGTEESVKREIGYYLEEQANGNKEFYNEYGIDIKYPFKGLFQREGKDFKYIINKTKGVCYSFDQTKILYQNGEESDYADPLPTLMGFGNYHEPGAWLGDIIEVADELPTGIRVLENVM